MASKLKMMGAAALMVSAMISRAGGDTAVDEARHYYHSGAGKPYFYCAVPAKKAGSR